MSANSQFKASELFQLKDFKAVVTGGGTGIGLMVGSHIIGSICAGAYVGSRLPKHLLRMARPCISPAGVRRSSRLPQTSMERVARSSREYVFCVFRLVLKLSSELLVISPPATTFSAPRRRSSRRSPEASTSL
jgi:hypothetical protein